MGTLRRAYDGLRLPTILTLAILGCAAAVAEENVRNKEQKKVLTTLEQRMQKKIDVNFREAGIDEVIAMFAEKADVDIVKSPTVTGPVTARLTQVPLEEALSNILAAHGWGYVADENIIRIAPLAELTQAAEAMVSKIWRVTYADVKEVELALKNFISTDGKVSSNPGTSNIIVTDTESKIKAIDTFIEEVDRVTPQILVEVRIYDITAREVLDLGVEWQAGRRTDFQNGVPLNPTAGRTDPFINSLFTGATSLSQDTDGFIRVGWLNDKIDIDGMLRAQQENVQAKLLANPRILVLDNETALFDIVREIPYKESTVGGNLSTETIQFKPVGVKLAVTPHVARDGMIRLNIVPEFGVIVGIDDITNVPTVDTRKVNTITLVQDGSTVVLGGLRKKDVSKQVNKIPLLGDLPLLGMLFRFEGEDTAVTELVVFITPRIVAHPILMSETEEQAWSETEFPPPAITYTWAEKSAEPEEQEDVETAQ